MKRLLMLVIALSTTARAQGLKGEYYSGLGIYPRLPDQPRMTRVDADIAFSDDPAHPAQPYNLPSSIVRNLNSVRWTGSFTATAGAHRFTIETDNMAVLSIDGSIVVDLRSNTTYIRQDGNVTLTDGPHFVELFYVRTGALGLIHMAAMRLPGTTIALSSFSVSPTYGSAYHSRSQTIDFEAPVANPPYLVDQYAASHGAHFIPQLADMGYPSKPKLIDVRPDQSSSGTHVVYNDSRDPVEAVSASAGVPLRILFDRPQLRVALKAGTIWNEAGRPLPMATLRAFNSDGQIVGADVVATLPLAVRTGLEVARGTADIAWVSLSYGDWPSGEVIDDLRLESVDTAPSVCAAALPQVDFISPSQDQEIFAGNGLVNATVRVGEPCGTLTAVSLLHGYDRGTLNPSVLPGCDAPRCYAFSGSIRLPPGDQWIRATATNSDGTFSNNTVRVRVHGARIHVNTAGAEVYVNGTRVRDLSGSDVTDRAGNMETATVLLAGSQIVARSLLFANGSPRSGHTGGSPDNFNWNYRVYNTNTFAGSDGRFRPFSVSDANAVQEVVIDPNNTLIGLHVVASIEWDASAAEMTFFRDQKLLPASRYLFNATDGQFFFEQIDIVDDAVNWSDTDYRIYADNTVHPNVNTRVSGFLGGGLPTHMHMRGLPAPGGVNDQGFSDFQVYAHEFGHFGFGLYDEYLGWADAHCTDLGRTDGTLPFNSGRPKATCMMWNEWGATKICSSLAENPHSWVNFQGTLNREDCWSTIVHNYSARSPFFRYALRTPQSRGASVESVTNPPVSSWTPTVTLTNASHPSLCQPISLTATDSGGRPWANASITFTTTYGARIYAGQTAPDGTIMVTGLHVGDRIDSSPTLVLTSAVCTPTM
jgi:hypothetical protein